MVIHDEHKFGTYQVIFEEFYSPLDGEALPFHCGVADLMFQESTISIGHGSIVSIHFELKQPQGPFLKCLSLGKKVC